MGTVLLQFLDFFLEVLGVKWEPGVRDGVGIDEGKV